MIEINEIVPRSRFKAIKFSLLNESSHELRYDKVSLLVEKIELHERPWLTASLGSIRPGNLTIGLSNRGPGLLSDARFVLSNRILDALFPVAARAFARDLPEGKTVELTLDSRAMCLDAFNKMTKQLSEEERDAWPGRFERDFADWLKKAGWRNQREAEEDTRRRYRVRDYSIPFVHTAPKPLDEVEERKRFIEHREEDFKRRWGADATIKVQDDVHLIYRSGSYERLVPVVFRPNYNLRIRRDDISVDPVEGPGTRHSKPCIIVHVERGAQLLQYSISERFAGRQLRFFSITVGATRSSLLRCRLSFRSAGDVVTSKPFLLEVWHQRGDGPHAYIDASETARLPDRFPLT